MDDELRTARASTFDGAADVYARFRPPYPRAAVSWLTGDSPRRVLEVAAGTGQLTGTIRELGHDLVATEPSPRMLRRLVSDHEVPALQCRAEELPLRAGSFDVVVAAQAYHWFDAGRTVPEIARVLRHGGTCALVWNFRDESIPWIKRLGQIIGSERFGSGQPRGIDWLKQSALGSSGLFAPIEKRSFGFWQDLDRAGLLGLVESRSYVIALDEDRRREVLAEVADLYDSYGRGHDGMRMRYTTECYRATVVKDSQAQEEVEPPGGGDLLFDFR